MHKLALFVGLVSLIGSGAAQAASYLDVLGTVHDPIQNTSGGNLPYSGDNLEPSAWLLNADLDHANLPEASLANAVLEGASLSHANLTGSDLSGVNLKNTQLYLTDFSDSNLSGASFYQANLDDADFTGADLSHTTWLGEAYGTPKYDAHTNFTGAWHSAGATGPFSPVNSGWTLVPEPTTALLLTLGLAGLGMRRRG